MQVLFKIQLQVFPFIFLKTQIPNNLKEPIESQESFQLYLPKI